MRGRCRAGDAPPTYTIVRYPTVLTGFAALKKGRKYSLPQSDKSRLAIPARLTNIHAFPMKPNVLTILIVCRLNVGATLIRSNITRCGDFTEGSLHPDTLDMETYEHVHPFSMLMREFNAYGAICRDHSLLHATCPSGRANRKVAVWRAWD